MEVPVHPILAKLGEGISGLTSFRGYVGPSATKGQVRLYPTLDDLTESIDIPQDDIVHVADAPESILPFGGKVIWVKRDASIARNHVESVARAKSDRGLIEVNKGRLRMLLRRALADDTCQSRCSVCQSRCSVCHSRCSAAFENEGGVGRFRLKAD